MANLEITFTVPSAKKQRIVDAMKGLYPIPSVTNKETGLEEPEFTDNQWAKEAIRRLIVRDVSRWETKVAKEAAAVKKDDEIVA
jgi:hypothetical protein